MYIVILENIWKNFIFWINIYIMMELHLIAKLIEVNS